MKIRSVFLLLMALMAFGFSGLKAQEKNKVEIKDGWFYVDGEKFFVKGVCYFEAHDVEGKYVQNSPDVLEYEFKKIKEAGFNTIRTYLTPEKIEIAKEYGLMIYQDSDRLCFSDEYLDSSKTENTKANIDQIVGFSRDYDNILFYSIDNEPSIDALYKQGEKNAEKFWRMLDARVKKVQPGARTSIPLMPPDAFSDDSMCDIATLNLYPFSTYSGSIGYEGYADWYKRTRAGKRPFIISEYGWTDDLKNMSPNMLKLLDQQLKAGVSGSFFFTWRPWHKDKTEASQWWGFIPSNGQPEDYLNEPRHIYYDYQRYFQAVVVEPKMDGIYTNRIPFEIYGTEKTGSVTVECGRIMTDLKKQGKFWWVGGQPFEKGLYGKQTVKITARDARGQTLVEKNIDVRFCALKKTLSVKIQRDKKPLAGGDSYAAKILVVDEKGRKMPGQSLALGINQTKFTPWTSSTQKAVTDANGEYLFTQANIMPGYFTLLAGADAADPDIRTFADVDMCRVEKNRNRNPNPSGEPLKGITSPDNWILVLDKDSRMKLSAMQKEEGGRVLEASYDLGQGNWAGFDEKTFHDYSKYKSARITFQDSGFQENFEFKILDGDGSVFTTLIKERSGEGNWKTAVVYFDDLSYGWGGDRILDLSSSKLSLAVSKAGGENQGSGKLTISKIEMLR